MDGYLTKPITLRTLSEVVERFGDPPVVQHAPADPADPRSPSRRTSPGCRITAAMPLLLSPRATRRQFLAAAGATAASLTFAGAQRAAPRRRRPSAAPGPALGHAHPGRCRPSGYRGFSPVDNLAKVVPQVLRRASSTARCSAATWRASRACPRTTRGCARCSAPSSPRCRPAWCSATTTIVPTSAPPSRRLHRAPPALPNKHASTREAGGLRFVLLDSLLATDVTPGQLGSAQRAWLATQLAAVDDADDHPGAPHAWRQRRRTDGRRAAVRGAEAASPRQGDHVRALAQVRSDRARGPAADQPAGCRLQLRRQRAGRLGRIGVDEPKAST